MLTPPVVSRLTRRLVRSIRRPLVAKQLAGHTKLHLACGEHLLDGWANVDLHPRQNVIGWDLTQPLPVRSETMELIYCEHFIEHITREQAAALLTECRRVLLPEGVLRLSTPNLRKLVEEYQAGRTSEWSDVGWTPRTPCRLINEGLRFWGHQFVYDADELQLLLEEAGYRNITPVAWHQSTTPALRHLECRPFHEDLIVEAMK